ncbi:carboxymuconolactone decarboxylase family protein [Aeromonas veronii]
MGRINYHKHSPELVGKMMSLYHALGESEIDNRVRHLIDIRVSQMNGCAFCLDMHIKEARLAGENELKLHHLVCWRESELFDRKEKAALEWAEVLTKLPKYGVSDEVYERVSGCFSEKELSDLTFVIMSINAWNRVNIAFRTPPGSFDKEMGLEGVF